MIRLPLASRQRFRRQAWLSPPPPSGNRLAAEGRRRLWRRASTRPLTEQEPAVTLLSALHVERGTASWSGSKPPCDPWGLLAREERHATPGRTHRYRS